MNVSDIYDELATALATISGLRVFPYWAERITPPAAVIGWPETIVFDKTFGRGSDALELPVYVLVGKVDARSSQTQLAAYLDGAGSASVKAALDGGTYTACDSVTVTQARVEVMTVAAVDYLAAIFTVSIYGTGA